MDESFMIISENEYEQFEEYANKARKVWDETFGNENTYEQNEGDNLLIYIKNGIVVSCAILNINNSNNIALLSCMGAYPQNCGYGSSLMKHMVEHYKNKIKIYLKIDNFTNPLYFDEDKIPINLENTNKLKKFYSKFGFVIDNDMLERYKNFKINYNPRGDSDNNVEYSDNDIEIFEFLKIYWAQELIMSY